MIPVPLVAVVIPVFNPDERHLKEALNSLESQTYRRWEAIIVDDGSDLTDLSWARQTMIRQQNAGVAAARNAGVKATSAPLLAFLDQDDLWHPEYLERQVAEFSDPTVVISSTDFRIINDQGAVIGDGYVGGYANYSELLAGCGLQLSGVMARRTAFELVGGFRDYAFAQDWDLWLRILQGGGRAARVPEVLMQWRMHGHNASRNYKALWRDSREILVDHHHPSAELGRRHMRALSGAQAFDRARESRDFDALRWAMQHAPRYTATQLLSWPMGWVLRRSRRK